MKVLFIVFGIIGGLLGGMGMGGHLVVDVDDRLLEVVLEDTGIVLRKTVDVTDLYRIGLCSMDGH